MKDFFQWQGPSMKSKKPKSTALRDQLRAAILSEAARQAVKLIGTVAIAVIMQHIGHSPAPELLLV
jgi:hypothetical protein